MNNIKTPLSDSLDETIASLIGSYAQLLALETSTGDKQLKRELRNKLVRSELAIKSIASKVGALCYK